MNNADYKKIALNHVKKIRKLEDEVIPKLKSDIFNLRQVIKDGKLLELGGNEDALRKLIDILGDSSLLLMRVMARRNDDDKKDIEAFNALTKQHNDLTAELARVLDNKTFVKCDCGDSYDTTSYGAGYIDACGKCPNCKLENASDIEGEWREISLCPNVGLNNDDEITEIIIERDKWEDRATELAELVGKHLGIDVGEHSSANCPVGIAIEALTLRLYTDKKEPEQQKEGSQHD